MKNALSLAILATRKDGKALIELLSAGYGSELRNFTHGNNDESLRDSIALLSTSKMDKAIAEAMTAGRIASGLTVGYIGARAGKFDKQPDDVRAVYDNAHSSAVSAFTASLEASGVFEAPTPKTDAEKLAAKAEKAEKAEKTLNDTINAKIQAGELVRADSVKTLTISDIGQAECIDLIIGAITSDTLDTDNLKMLITALRDAGHVTVPKVKAKA